MSPNTDSPYDQNVRDFRDYENPDGNSIPHDAPRDSANEAFGFLTGRMYSAQFVREGLTIGDSATISMMRFKVNGGKTIIGRKIVLMHILDSEILQSLAYIAYKTMPKRQNPSKLALDDGTIVSFWMTESGKITRYGKPCNGDIVVKHTAPKQYKRNRRNNW